MMILDGTRELCTVTALLYCDYTAVSRIARAIGIYLYTRNTANDETFYFRERYRRKISIDCENTLTYTFIRE